MMTQTTDCRMFNYFSACLLIPILVTDCGKRLPVAPRASIPLAEELVFYNWEADMPLLAPDILNNPFIFPSNEDLINAELILALTSEGQKLYDRIWEQFTANP